MTKDSLAAQLIYISVLQWWARAVAASLTDTSGTDPGAAKAKSSRKF